MCLHVSVFVDFAQMLFFSGAVKAAHKFGLALLLERSRVCVCVCELQSFTGVCVVSGWVAGFSGGRGGDRRCLGATMYSICVTYFTGVVMYVAVKPF